MSIRIFGASDDRIEIRGDLDEEFYVPYDSPGGWIATNWSCVGIRYLDGVWRITPAGGSAEIVQAPANDEDNYSDIATIHGDIEWVVFGQAAALKPARKEKQV